jgi:hypothetical protein
MQMEQRAGRLLNRWRLWAVVAERDSAFEDFLESLLHQLDFH